MKQKLRAKLLTIMLWGVIGITGTSIATVTVCLLQLNHNTVCSIPSDRLPKDEEEENG